MCELLTGIIVKMFDSIAQLPACVYVKLLPTGILEINFHHPIFPTLIHQLMRQNYFLGGSYYVIFIADICRLLYNVFGLKTCARKLLSFVAIMGIKFN